MPSRATRTRPAGVALMLLCLTGLAAAADEVIEKTLAFVNRKAVLMSDVALTRTLLGGSDASALERTIDEVLMSEEAARLVSDSLSDAEIAAATQNLKEKTGAQFGAEALRRKAVVQLIISKYIDMRLRPLVRIDDAEVRRVYNERLAQDPFTPEFSTAAPAIREVLERRALDQRIEEWIASLRRRDEVRRPQARRP